MAEGYFVKPSRLHTLLVKRAPGYNSFVLIGTVEGRPKKQSLNENLLIILSMLLIL